MKQFIIVLALLSSLAAIGGCAAGGSSGSASPATSAGSGATPFQTGSGTGTAVLGWDAPTTNVDGSSLDDLAGYKIYVGTAAGNYAATLDVGNVTDFSMDNLVPGTYYFAVTAYNTSGMESSYSNEGTKTIL